MPATSATHAIFFIISVLVAVALAGVMYAVVMDFAESLEDRSDRLVEDMETDIAIANDERKVPYQNATLGIYVMNTGRRTLNPDELVVFVDGSFRNVTSHAFFRGGSHWSPGTAVNLSVYAENLSYDSDHTLKVAMKNGNEDTMVFRLTQEGAGEDVTIGIESDAGAVPYHKNNVTLIISVRNTGDAEIDTNSTSILINGELSDITNITLWNNETRWLPDVVAVFNVTVEDLEEKVTYRMKVVVEGGAQASMDFEIEIKD